MSTDSLSQGANLSGHQEVLATEQGGEQVEGKPYLLFNDDSPEFQQKVDVIDAIVQAPNKNARREAIAEAAKALGKSTRTIKRMIERVQKDGVATLAVGRQDKGQFRISEQWFKFIVDTHEWGQREGSRINHNQIHGYLIALASEGEELRSKKYAKKLKQYPEVLEDLIERKYPSHVTVYKVINFHIKQENRIVRHPGSPREGQIIQTTEGILEITHSNEIWQVDHTKLDILLIDDEDKEIIGRPYITLVMDSYSGCVVGFYLGYESAGSHEVALAFRHSILPKHYEPEYKLQEKWDIFGVPEYLVTDRAKEFKSDHLKQISLQLGFQRRLRAFPSAGGLIETIFDKINKEVLSFFGGYTGSSIEDRPKEAEKTACLTLDQLEQILVRYFVDHSTRHDYNYKPDYSNREIKNRIGRWKSKLSSEPEVLNERELDICLMKTTYRNVEKYGSVNFGGLVYQGDSLVRYEGQKISLRYDQRNILTLLAYTRPSNDQPGEFIGVVKARKLEKERLSLGELNWIKKKLRKESKEVDNSSILNERLDIFEKVEEGRKSRRKRQRKAQEKHAHKSNKSKVLEMFPENATLEETAITQENSPSAPTTSQNVVKSINKQDIPEANRTAKTRRPRVGVQDWNQFVKDNW
jgi:putative transposase